MSASALPRALAAPDRITLVSGLPRSGTSLLMQLLGAAGLDLAHDDVRAPDADNPRGYFELDDARRIRRNPEFLAACRGRVLKLVAPLALELDPAIATRTIFVERDLGEVLASQQVMLARRGEPWRSEAEPALRRAFEGVLARCRERFAASADSPVLFVDHGALIRSPSREIDRIVEFLVATSGAQAGSRRAPGQASIGEGFAATLAAMRAVVDPALYRQRAR